MNEKCTLSVGYIDKYQEMRAGIIFLAKKKKIILFPVILLIL